MNEELSYATSSTSLHETDSIMHETLQYRQVDDILQVDGDTHASSSSLHRESISSRFRSKVAAFMLKTVDSMKSSSAAPQPTTAHKPRIYLYSRITRL